MTVTEQQAPAVISSKTNFKTGLELAQEQGIKLKRPSAYDPEQNARMRALVRKAVMNRAGRTYKQIRQWIKEHYCFDMENVGARVRELTHDKNFAPHDFITLYDDAGTAYVFPKEFFETNQIIEQIGGASANQESLT